MTAVDLLSYFINDYQFSLLMKWFKSETELDSLLKQGNKWKVVFKHSTRCPISARAWHQMDLIEKKWHSQIEFYGVDVIEQRGISNKIALVFKIHHESPQLLLIKDTICVSNRSHFQITESEFSEMMTSVGL